MRCLGRKHQRGGPRGVIPRCEVRSSLLQQLLHSLTQRREALPGERLMIKSATAFTLWSWGPSGRLMSIVCGVGKPEFQCLPCSYGW